MSDHPLTSDAARGFEPAFLRQLGPGFRHSQEGSRGGYDIESDDRRSAIELKLSLRGTRDLDAALLQLAVLLAHRPELRRAALVARLPRITARRVEEQWQRLQRTIRPEVIKRLAIVAVAADGAIALPGDDPLVVRLLSVARTAFEGIGLRNADQPKAAWSLKSFEAWKVLLSAWLRCEGFLSIQEVARRSGCSLPTLRQTLTRLQNRGELERKSNRSVALSDLPRRSLGEILVLADGLRNTARFADASGRSPDPVTLLRRIRSRAVPGIAVGGVAAAREYVPTFDLNGLPRVDITAHGGSSLEWVKSVDPGLRRIDGDNPFPILVVHRLFRPEASFEIRKHSRVPLADPAETVLDLYELRLDEQAEDFVRSLRRKAPHV